MQAPVNLILIRDCIQSIIRRKPRPDLGWGFRPFDSEQANCSWRGARHKVKREGRWIRTPNPSVTGQTVVWIVYWAEHFVISDRGNILNNILRNIRRSDELSETKEEGIGGRSESWLREDKKAIACFQVQFHHQVSRFAFEDTKRMSSESKYRFKSQNSLSEERDGESAFVRTQTHR